MNSPSTEAVVDALKALARIASELGLVKAEWAVETVAAKAAEAVTA